MSDPLIDAVARLREAGIPNPRLDARLLWEFAQTGSSLAEGGEGGPPRSDGGGGSRTRRPPPSRSAVALRSTSPAEAGEEPKAFASLITRRAAREPLAYIVGRKEFWSLDFAVGPGCLIPRPDTETLIEELIRLHPDRAAPLAILDLGTGSGCLLIAALHEYPNARGVGIDSGPDALAWARTNLAVHRMADRATLIETGWLEDADPGFDLVLCNPPYIPSGEIDGLEPEVSRYEPRAALDGGADGLDAYRALARRIGRLLKPSGRALLELGAGQDRAVPGLMAAEGLETPQIGRDLAGIPRCMVVKQPDRPI